MVSYPKIKTVERDFNKESVNKFIPHHFTYLNWAISRNDIIMAEKLLDIGANPDGISDVGLTFRIPFTSLDFSSSQCEHIIRLLLKYGANINGEDLRGHNIITSFMIYLISSEKIDVTFSRTKSIRDKQLSIIDSYIKQLLFILERGANPNGTIFHNPLLYCVKFLFKTNRASCLNILSDIFEILISFGANPNYEVVELSLKNNIYTTANKSNGKGSSKFESISKLFRLDVEEVINECESEPLVISLSKFYKLPIPKEINQKIKKDLCLCIKKIRDNRKEYDESTFSKLRGTIRRMNKVKCNNSELLSGDSIDSFPDSELIYLKENNPSATYCFHVSDIPVLLQNKTNPYNRKPFDKEFVNDLTNKYKYSIPKTLEESLENVFESREININEIVLLEKISSYVKTFNSYIDTENLKDIPHTDLFELLNLLYGGNNDILATIQVTDRRRLLGESIEHTNKRILTRTVTHLILYLQTHENSLPFISNIINQLLIDVHVAKQIMNLFPVFKRKNIRGILAVYSYEQFMKEFYKYIIIDNSDISLITGDRKFLNSLTDDEKATIQFIDNKSFLKIYMRYIGENITEILNSAFGSDVPIRDLWANIVQALIRNTD